jgi:hypothetical protein
MRCVLFSPSLHRRGQALATSPGHGHQPLPSPHTHLLLIELSSQPLRLVLVRCAQARLSCCLQRDHWKRKKPILDSSTVWPSHSVWRHCAPARLSCCLQRDHQLVLNGLVQGVTARGSLDPNPHEITQHKRDHHVHPLPVCVLSSLWLCDV